MERGTDKTSRASRALRVAPLLALLAHAAPAQALRIEAGDTPIQLDFSEDATVDYHFSHGNGNIEPPSNPNYDPTSDNYLDWFNRFDAQLSAGDWHAELRFDSAVFANSPAVSDVSTVAGNHLSLLLENRYIDNFEVEKISASYNSRYLQATVGDFHLTYGRGLILSLLQIDALGVDTTLRGASVTGRIAGLSLNVSGGVTNVVNTDPATGSVAPDPDDPIAAARLEYRLPQLFAVGIDGAVLWQNASTLALSSWAPGTPTNSVPISYLGFGSVQTEPASQFARGSTRTENFSATLELPSLWGHGSAYAELAHQVQDFTTGSATTEETGNALYAGVNLYFGRLTLQAELKDYLYFNAPIFSSLPSNLFVAFTQQDVYNNPPNLEEIWQEETSTAHIYGPRVRLDWQATEHLKPYALVSYFVDDENGYDIYNGALGVEGNWADKHEHIAAAAGYRREIYNATSTDPGLIHATELWLQFDLIQKLTADYSIELEGLIREHRDYAFQVAYLEWNQSYAYLSLRHTRFSASVGYELYTQFVNEYQPQNLNVSGSVHVTKNWLVRAFVGSREAGLRCINGVCRNYPGFQGATVEIVARY